MKKLFIGIDFSKEKFDATIISSCGIKETEARQHGIFHNTVTGYREFHKWVALNSHQTANQEWLFCGEDTGSCSIGLSNWLYGKGYDFWLANAYAIKHSSGIQRVKSDKADSAIIAEYAKRYHDKAVIFEPLSESLSQLREMFLFRHKLVAQKVSLEVRVIDKNAIGDRKVQSFMKNKSKRIISEIDKAIIECDKSIDRIISEDEELKENYALITSVKGISRQNAACIMIYTNNFKKFGYDSRKIACYYGIAPFGKQSGTSVKSPAHTSHFANKLIKALLGQAALCAIAYNPEIMEYYKRMLEKGKKIQVAINNVKNKLIRIIVTLVRKKEMYDPNVYKAYSERIQYVQYKNEKISNVNLVLKSDF